MVPESEATGAEAVAGVSRWPESNAIDLESGGASSYSRLFSGLEVYWNLCCSAWFLTCMGLMTPLYISCWLLWNGNVYNCYSMAVCPIIVSWKQITCFLVSQIHRWGGILPWDGLILSKLNNSRHELSGKDKF